MSGAIMSEDIQTTDTASGDPTDQIAELLLGEEEQPTESDDLADEETPSAESTEEEEVNESESESEEETTLEDVADEDTTWGGALGVPEEALAFDEAGNIAGVNVKVNGKSSTVSMSDLIKDYQGDKSFTEKSQYLSAEKKKFDEQIQVVEQEYASKLENVETITNYLSNKLVSEFEGLNWDQLRVENPAEYAAARQDYAARAQELKQAQDAVAQEKEQATTAKTQEFQQKQQVYMKEQFEKMVEANPTWADEAVLAKDMSELRTFGKSQYGFSDQDFSHVTDARLIELLKDAKAYRTGVKVATEKLKRPVPKFQKSKGKAASKKVSKLDKLTKAAQKATGTNKRDLQTEAIAELLG